MSSWDSKLKSCSRKLHREREILCNIAKINLSSVWQSFLKWASKPKISQNPKNLIFINWLVMMKWTLKYHFLRKIHSLSTVVRLRKWKIKPNNCQLNLIKIQIKLIYALPKKNNKIWVKKIYLRKSLKTQILKIVWKFKCFIKAKKILNNWNPIKLRKAISIFKLSREKIKSIN
jgi:hypothetical protein